MISEWEARVSKNWQCLAYSMSANNLSRSCRQFHWFKSTDTNSAIFLHVTEKAMVMLTPSFELSNG